jgi:CPA1 family monovalent cation:H+ antiporter
VKSYLHRFWDYAAFVANSLIFLLVGMQVNLSSLWNYAVPLAFTILAVLLARAVTVYGIVPIIGKLPGAEPIGMRYQTVLFWGGLKGAVALALALSLPHDFPNHDLIVALALGVVLFTLVIGGVTTGPLIRLLGLDRPSLAERLAKASAVLAAKREGLARMDGLESAGHYSRQLLQQLREDYQGQVEAAEKDLATVRVEAESDAKVMLQVLWSEALSIEQTTHRELFDRGAISEPVFRELELALDLQRDVLKRGDIPTDFPSSAPLEVRAEGWIVALIQRVASRSGFVERYRRRELAAKHEHCSAVLAATERVTSEINNLAELSGVDPSVAQQCREKFENRSREAMEQIDSIAQVFPEYVQAVQTQTARRIALDAEVDALEQLVAVGGIPDSIAKTVRAGVDKAYRELARQPLSALEARPEELLKRVPMFEKLDETDFQRLVDTLVPRTVLAGEKIIQQGERGTSLFLIARGVVAVLVARGSTPASRVASLHAGEFFGEMALLTDEPRNATVMAATDCRLFELSRRDVEALCGVCEGVKDALEAAARDRAPANNTQ